MWIDYPIYHLIFNRIFQEDGIISVFAQNEKDKKEDKEKEHVLDISRTNGREKINLTIKTDNPKNYNKLSGCLYRCGFLRSPSWSNKAEELAKFDDVILGLDTNILREAVITEQLLNSITMLDPREFVHTPNFILLVVPSTVLRELEQAANHRNDRGFLDEVGRMGYRGIQELLEIEQSADIPGVSLLTIGGAIPELDTRYEMQGLSRQLTGTSEKMSSNDMIIRDQFKTFIRESGFNKGVFFITSDKSNAALAETEGLNGMLYRRAEINQLKGKDSASDMTITVPSEDISCDIHDHPVDDKIVISAPVGKLLYELCVEFGEIKVKTEQQSIQLKCDLMGRTLEHWHLRQLIVDKEKIRETINSYWNGTFSLKGIKREWRAFNERFISVETGNSN